MKFSSLITVCTAALASATSDWHKLKWTEVDTQIRENTYHYVRVEAFGEYKGTVVLIHGFPDLPYGWRNQLPLLTSMGYRVLIPTNLGYPGTSAPAALEPYAATPLSNDLVDIIKEVVGDEQVIIGGHDWGASFVWQVSLRHPDMFRAIFNLATPYGPPTPQYVDLADQIVANQSLNLQYQLQLREPSFPAKLAGPKKIRQALRAIFGGVAPDGTPGVDYVNGFNLDILDTIQPAPLLPSYIEDLYVKKFTSGGRNDLEGPFHWYRLFPLNYKDNTAFAAAGGSFRISKPTLFVCGISDEYLPCSYSRAMDPLLSDLTRVELDSGHWIQIEKKDEFNAALKEWLEKVDPSDCSS